MTQRLLGLLSLGLVLGLVGCHHVAGICDCENGHGCQRSTASIIAADPVPPPLPVIERMPPPR